MTGRARFAGWIVTSPEGGIIPWSFEAGRRESIRALRTFGVGEARSRSWRQLYRAGWRCVRATVEIGPGAG